MKLKPRLLIVEDDDLQYEIYEETLSVYEVKFDVELRLFTPGAFGKGYRSRNAFPSRLNRSLGI